MRWHALAQQADEPQMGNTIWGLFYIRAKMLRWVM